MAEGLDIEIRKRKFGARFGMGEFAYKKLIRVETVAVHEPQRPGRRDGDGLL